MGISKEKTIICAGPGDYKKREIEAQCCNCSCNRHVLGCLEDCRGALSVRWWCASCNRCVDARGGNISHVKLKHLGIDVKSLPVMRRNEGFPCERCGVLQSEEHHWAPWELFDDADEWPKSQLCTKCHMKWHQVINRHRSVA
jgi:hypothetical protein